jgi:type IV pilus assembly protein PilQ
LAEEMRRRMDVTDFATPVTTVTTTRQGENARIVIAAQGLWEHTAYQSDNQFVIEVKPLKEDPSKLFQGSQRQGYQGEKVSLNFQNIPLRELLHVFADITSFNIVISDTVAGNVSLRLNDVPWDQALDIVLKQKGLAMRKNGNVIWIAPGDELAAREKLDLESLLAIADLEPVRTESFQLNYQKADVVEKMLRGISTGGASAGGSTTPTGKGSARVLSERGSAIFDQRTNKLFVSDTPSKLAEVRRLIAEIDVAVRQVLIEARIVEADDTFSKSLGARLGGSDNKGMTNGNPLFGSNNLRWGVAGSTSDANRLMSYYPNSLNSPPQFGAFPTNYVPSGRVTDISYKKELDLNGNPIIDKITFDQASPSTSTIFRDQQFVNLPASNAAGQFALTLFSKGMAQLLTLEISAMEADGKGKTISSPRVLTADQKEATIEDGQELPYWSASSSGATTVAYRKAVLSLNVTPQITPDGKVLMSLKVNKDNVNPSLSTSYGLAIDTKNVKTDVLVENGGTVVIGGIYVQETRNTITRVPVLGDVPLLGNLFRKTDKTDNRRELLVFVTPKIVADTLSLR